MKKTPDYAFIKAMLKYVETPAVRVLHEPHYAAILMPAKRNAERLQAIQELMPDVLHILVKCDNVVAIANVLAEKFDNVNAGVHQFSTIQDGVKVVFSFTSDSGQNAIYHFDNSLNILRDDIPWLGVPDYLRTIAYNPASKLYDARAELVARFLYNYTGAQGWMAVADSIETMVPEDVVVGFRQSLIDAISIAAKRLDVDKLW